LNPAEFRRVLNLGLGRVIVHLQTADATPYQDAILYACLHSTAYDPQIEGSRAAYIHEVIQLTGKYEFYRDQVIAALEKSPPSDERDRGLLLELTANFAGDGYEPARQELYRQCVLDLQEGFDFASHLLIQVDGLEALRFLTEQANHVDWEDWSLDLLLIILEDDHSEDYSLDAICDVTKANSEFQRGIVATFHERKAKKTKGASNREEKYKIKPQEVRELISTNSKRIQNFSFLRQWGIYANEDDFLSAAHDLAAETDPERLRSYIRIFMKRPFPLDPQPLIEHAHRKNKRISHLDWYSDEWRELREVINALELLHHPEVRALGLELLQTVNRTGWGIELLIKNFQDGDWKLITNAVPQLQIDQDAAHAIGLAVLDVFDEHPNSEAEKALLVVYERTPCSRCRRHVVENLNKINRIPQWMIEECKFDSNYDLREAMINGFAEM